MRELLSRLRDWMRRDQLDAELREELQFHRERLERDANLNNVPDATRTARQRMGNQTRVREQARDCWSIPTIDNLQQDVRFAFRALRRSPGFSLTVIVTLALGIGANAEMFNVVDRLMFRPLAFLRNPSTVYRFYWQQDEHGAKQYSQTVSYKRYLDMRNWTTSFSEMAAFSERSLAVGSGEESAERKVGVVSASFFDFFDARPVLGRVFVASEDVTPQGADVAVLSYALWQSEFGKRNVLGEHLQVGNVNATIIGVLPDGFRGVGDTDPPMIYMPITTFAASAGTNDSKTYFLNHAWGWISVLVRRKATVPFEQAQADANIAIARSWEDARAQDPGFPPLGIAKPAAVLDSPRPGAGPNPGLQARVALWILIVAAVVLLIAMANVSNLFLARSLQRKRETAVRLALGVTRARLVLQSMLESLMLALCGAGAALLVAAWAGNGIRHLLISQNTFADAVADWRTLGVTIALAVLAGVTIGTIPALFLVRGDVAAKLRGGARGGTSDGARLRNALLIFQAAFSVVLLTGAALFVKSLDAVKSLPMGYTTKNVLEFGRVIRGTKITDSSHLELRRVLLETAQSLPQVESAAWVSSMPFTSTSSTRLYVTGIDSVSRLGSFTYQATTPDYFRTMGTRIVRGRGLHAEDRWGAPNVMVVSESMAKVLWPGNDAVGECIRVSADTMPCTTVVGVADDMVQRDLVGGTRYHFYMPADQYRSNRGFGMVLKVRGDADKEKENIRKALQHVMPGSSYIITRTLESVVEEEQRAWRMGATMFFAFGSLALLVAAVGLYGVIGYNVVQRMHELGVRVALGAQSSNIMRLVVGQSVTFALVGTVLGIVISLATSRYIQPLLFQQSAKDPLVFATVSIVMIVVAVGASALPARHASKANPNAALRAE